MDYKVDMKRREKCDSKKDRTDGPYSSKHLRNVEHIGELRSIRNAVRKANISINSSSKISKSKSKSR